MDGPGMVAIRAHGRITRENDVFPVPVRACKAGLAERVRPSRPASARSSFSTLRLNLVVTQNSGANNKCKDSVVKSGVCGSVSRFDIAETGAVHTEVARGKLCFPPPMLGLTIRVEGRRQCFTSRDKKGCKEELSSGGQVLTVFFIEFL